jgi:hypothetical protein
MVTGSLKREFDRLGVDLIPLDAGAQSMVDELCETAPAAVEVVIGGAFPESVAPAENEISQPAVQVDDRLSVVLERRVDVGTHPFLASHLIGKKPVLPMAMMLEWLAHGALHDNPGLQLAGLDNLRVFKGVILDGPRDLEVAASRARRVDDQYELTVELRGRVGERRSLHARATAILTDRLRQAPPIESPAGLTEKPYARGIEGAYRDVLFHGSHLRAIKSIAGYSPKGLIAELLPAPAPAEWMDAPLRSAWIGDPLVVDGALQLGILWCRELLGAVSLPSFGASYRQYVASFPADGVTAAMVVRDSSSKKMTAYVTFTDRAGRVVAQMRGFEWTVDASLAAAFGHGAPTRAHR